MRAGASDEGLSPASLGLLKRGEVELVEVRLDLLVVTEAPI
jgi:hypothetical protein